jgi:hypothetical protein
VPKLIESVITEAAKTRLRSFNLTLPTLAVTGKPANPTQLLVQSRSTGVTGFAPKLSVGVTSMFVPKPGATAPPMRPAAIPQNVPPALFRAATNDKVDVDFQTEATNEYSNYLSSICRAIALAHETWRLGARFRGVMINGISASGGSVSGPLLSPLIVGNGPQQGLWGNAPAYTRAIADGLGSCWHDWEQSVRVPNLPWYPSFVAFPGPSAPPMPNVPSPMTALTWSPGAIAADTIKATITRKLLQPGPYSDELFQAVAAGFTAALAMWFPAQTVSNVLGRGSVPNFAPPYVPVGPVVAGSIIEAGSHFSA